jgi:hypothetical protein
MRAYIELTYTWYSRANLSYNTEPMHARTNPMRAGQFYNNYCVSFCFEWFLI